MASFRSTKLKITIGYILLLAILLFSLVFVHQERRRCRLRTISRICGQTVC